MHLCTDDERENSRSDSSRKRRELAMRMITLTSSPVPIVRGTVLGVYLPSSNPLPVLGTSTANIGTGICRSNSMLGENTLTCTPRSNVALHVEAIISM